MNILREHFRQDGIAKKSFSAARAAALAAQFNQQAYRCQMCQAWHLASLEEK
jgi:hypothetical protein